MLRVILGQGMRLTIVGVVIGLGAALGLTRLMSSLLFGIGSTDPWTFTSVAVLLLCVAAVGVLPAGAAGDERRSDDRAQTGVGVGVAAFLCVLNTCSHHGF